MPKRIKSKEDAKEILRHGEVHGKKLTKKQKGYFGAIAGGDIPSPDKNVKGGASPYTTKEKSGSATIKNYDPKNSHPFEDGEKPNIAKKFKPED